MARHASAIAAAEQRADRARGEMHAGFRRLRAKVSRPAFLVAALALGGFLAFVLTHRGRTGALLRPLATAMLIQALKHLIGAPANRLPPQASAMMPGADTIPPDHQPAAHLFDASRGAGRA
jgi:hypothetical protein